MLPAAGKPKQDLVLPFYTSGRPPRSRRPRISCTVTTSAGEATVRTAGKLAEHSPPIDEEAEEKTKKSEEEGE